MKDRIDIEIQAIKTQIVEKLKKLPRLTNSGTQQGGEIDFIGYEYRSQSFKSSTITNIVVDLEVLAPEIRVVLANYFKKEGYRKLINHWFAKDYRVPNEDKRTILINPDTGIKLIVVEFESKSYSIAINDMLNEIENILYGLESSIVKIQRLRMDAATEGTVLVTQAAFPSVQNPLQVELLKLKMENEKI
jgi:hypothetical protein